MKPNLLISGTLSLVGMIGTAYAQAEERYEFLYSFGTTCG